MTKKITIEDLVKMTVRGFAETKKEISEVRKEVGDVRKKVGDVRKEVGSLKTSVDNGFLNVNARLDTLEQDVKDIRQKLKIGISREEYFELEKRSTVIEGRLGIRY